MKNADKPAFPIKGIDNEDYLEQCELAKGLTKRERFAMAAMQGYCGGEWTGQSGIPHSKIAEWSVGMADTLLNELEETE